MEMPRMAKRRMQASLVIAILLQASEQEEEGSEKIRGLL